MKPAPFEYHAPESLSDVTALLAEHGDEAKVLAGGQSLVPMLALRLTRFEHIVDLNRVDDLRGVSRSNGTLTVKAMTTQRTVEHDAAAGEAVPLLARGHPAHRSLPDPQPRHRRWLDRPRRPRVGAAGGRARARRRARDRRRERHPHRPGVGVLRRHVDHQRRRGRDPRARCTSPCGRAAPASRSRRSRAAAATSRSPAWSPRSRSTAAAPCPAPASRSSAWGPRRCAPARPSRRWSAPRPPTADLEEIGRLAVADTDPTADVHASAEYRKHVGAHLVVRALDRALGVARG